LQVAIQDQTLDRQSATEVPAVRLVSALAEDYRQAA